MEIDILVALAIAEKYVIDIAGEIAFIESAGYYSHSNVRAANAWPRLGRMCSRVLRLFGISHRRFCNSLCWGIHNSGGNPDWRQFSNVWLIQFALKRTHLLPNIVVVQVCAATGHTSFVQFIK